jgi:hypothetical protein
MTDRDVIPVSHGLGGRSFLSDGQNRYPVSSRVRLTRVENSAVEIPLSATWVESMQVSAYVVRHRIDLP